jgi:exonuclease VII large subunit
MMNYTEQLEELQQRVDGAVEEVREAAVEDHEQLAARIDKNQQDLQSVVHKGQQRLDQAADQVESKWVQVKADASVKVADLKARMEQRRRERDAEAATTDADWAEADAEAAIDLASWATDNARLAILDALDARGYADELTKLAAQPR